MGFVTGLCRSTNRVTATARSYGGNDQHNQLWTVSGGDIRSYQNALCPNNDKNVLSRGRVNLWLCRGLQNQRWQFTSGFIKSVYDGRCLEFNKYDKYVYGATCNAVSTD